MIKEERRKKRRKKHLFGAFLGFVFVLAVLAVIVIKVFTVENVEIAGNELYDEQLIKDTVLNDEYSWNSLYVYIKYKIVDTDEIPFIDTMTISLKNPHTLHIKVYEKGMMGYLYISGIDQNAYFDKDGIVVETSSEEIEDVPQIKGIDCEQVVLYEKLPIDNKKLREILTLTQSLKREKLVPKSITYGKPDEPILSYGKTKVNIGDTRLLTKKIERLSVILPQINGTKGTLHLESWTEETTNIVFDKKK